MLSLVCYTCANPITFIGALQSVGNYLVHQLETQFIYYFIKTSPPNQHGNSHSADHLKALKKPHRTFMCVYRYIFIHTYLNCSHPCKIPPKKFIFGSSTIWVLKAILFYQRTSSFLRHIKQGSRHKLLAFAHLVIHLVVMNLFKLW